MSTEDMPGLTTDMPSLSSSATSTSSQTWTTPSVTVPANSNNPYISRSSDITGTVFIAVGSIVGFILLSFIGYHLFISLRASFLAKRVSESDRMMYEKYQNNNNIAYGGNVLSTTSTLGYGNDLQGSVSKLPLFSHNRNKSNFSAYNLSQSADTSTIFASEATGPTAKHDVTKMYISPTAEVLTHKRNKSLPLGGTNSSIIAGSTSSFASPQPATNRHSQLIPNLYLSGNDESTYSLTGTSVSQSGMRSPETISKSRRDAYDTSNREKRKPIPSMVLDDLLNE